MRGVYAWIALVLVWGASYFLPPSPRLQNFQLVFGFVLVVFFLFLIIEESRSNEERLARLLVMVILYHKLNKLPGRELAGLMGVHEKFMIRILHSLENEGILYSGENPALAELSSAVPPKPVDRLFWLTGQGKKEMEFFYRE